MKNIILFLSLITFFTSCKSVTKKLYGVKDPKVESISSIQEYLMKNKIDTSKTVLFKNLRSFAIASNSKTLVVPDALFFNADGDLISYAKSTESCNANVDDFISDLKNINEKESDSPFNLYSLNALIQNTQKESLELNEKQDAYVFITWSRYVGKLNKTKAFAWIDLIEKAKNENVKVKYYLLNCDFQESWEMSEDQLKNLGLKST